MALSHPIHYTLQRRGLQYSLKVIPCTRQRRHSRRSQGLGRDKAAHSKPDDDSRRDENWTEYQEQRGGDGEPNHAGSEGQASEEEEGAASGKKCDEC